MFNLVIGQLDNPEGHKKVNRALTGFFGNRINHVINSAIQFLMQFEFYRDLVIAHNPKSKYIMSKIGNCNNFKIFLERQKRHSFEPLRPM